MYCPKCGAGITQWATLCGNCGAAVTPSPPPYKGAFKNPRRLSLILQGLLAANLAAYVASGLLVLWLLSAMQATDDSSALASDLDVIASIEARERLMQVVTVGNVMLALVTMGSFGMWIYRMSANVHALGARDLRFTPGWSVGWFFVPIANLWMPYKAMSEILRASRNTANWPADRAGPLVGLWWGLYLSTWISNTIVERVTAEAETLEELIPVMRWGTASYGLDILCALTALVLVRAIYKHQANAANRSLAAVFA